MLELNPLNHPICLLQPDRLTPFSAWHEHIPFAMFLVDILRPAMIVELGTQHGDSYCAFCQAVKRLNLDTRCYAIDTWQGDAQTGFYGAEVLESLRHYHDLRYGNFSRLIQSAFDDALAHFMDGTIDILHIDGYHTYEAVRHDFESWLPKLSTCGIVLFHDTNVHEHNFGVWRHWQEVSGKYSSYEFLHGYGLGVLAPGNIRSKWLQGIVDADGEDIARIRDCFFQLGHRWTIYSDLRAKNAELAHTQEVLSQRDAKLAHAQEVLSQRDVALSSYEETLRGKDEQLVNAREVLSQHDKHLGHLQEVLGQRDERLAELQEALRIKDEHLALFQEVLRQRDEQVATFQEALQVRDTQLTHGQETLRQRDEQVATFHDITKRAEVHITHLEETLRRIHSSRGWKALSVGYRLKDILKAIIYGKHTYWLRALIPQARSFVGAERPLIFTCNICGCRNIKPLAAFGREVSTCDRCHSTVRMRSIIHVLSVELFGRCLALNAFPTDKNLKGLGMSDWTTYADPLATKLDYQNTFYHCEPQFDICHPDSSLFGTLDFIIATDVFEHVPPPVERAFENARKLLKPSGVFVFSVPYKLEGETEEHYPQLYDYEIVTDGDEPVLVNHTCDGVEQRFTELVFHGGEGTTLEMRLFSQNDLLDHIASCGFAAVTYADSHPSCGMIWEGRQSLTMALRPDGGLGR